MEIKPNGETQETMVLLSKVLGFDIIELWYESNEAIKFIHRHITNSLIQNNKILRSDYLNKLPYLDNLSLKICQIAKKNNFHWKASHDSTFNKILYMDRKDDIATEMAYKLDPPEDNLLIYITGYSPHYIEYHPSKISYLSGIAFSLYISAFVFRENESYNNNNNNNNNEIIYFKKEVALIDNDQNNKILGEVAYVKNPNAINIGNIFTSDKKIKPHYFSVSFDSFPMAYSIPFDLNPNDFVDIKHISDGSSSNIFTAIFQSEKVIIKMIKEDIQNDYVAIHEFYRELEILTHVNHPNIIKVKGAGKIPRRFIVLEYLGGGSLQTMLSQNQFKLGLANIIFRRSTFTYLNLLIKSRDMADALNYLHEGVFEGVTVIHRDLKPDNVGFSSDGSLKLFDFGLSTCVNQRVSSSQLYEMTGNTGSLRYMAPEVALKRPYSEKVDVYSFGILVWQMARDKIPFKDCNVNDFMKNIVIGGQRPKLDKSWPVGFSSLLKRCWSADASQRPSFSQLLSEFNELIATEMLKVSPTSQDSVF